MSEDSFLKLHADLAWVVALLWIAKVGRPGEPTADVHVFLGDRYWRLADRYRRKGFTKRAKRLREKAEWHLKASGWRPGPPGGSGPPYAAAMAMPIPKRPTFTQAIGWYSRETPPDDAA